MQRPLKWSAMSVVLALVFAPGCRKAAAPPPLPHVVVAPCEVVPESPQDPAWEAVPEYVARLIPQDLVEPRLLRPTTPEVRVRAVSDGRRLAFRLTWDDATHDDLAGTAQFVDACAVQMPRVIEPTVPAPQMGEPGRPVEIVLWNATWQAVVDGRGDTIRDIHPHAAVDHYPFEAASLEPGSAPQRSMAARY
ncbi:MAG: ethylbenzene dehydrogenase-related protein, partial [Thermoguttaceae bacterium]|nr:ethylbenzene dehydrogenase-related protein [Thermoguttaceae bacterium]